MAVTIDPVDVLPGGFEREFLFAGFRLDADGTLRRANAVVHLPPKELAALRFLLNRPGQVVSPLELKRALWGDLHVTDDSVPKCVSSLRARLEPEACIQTVYKRGYRFTAEVRIQSAVESAPLPRLAIMPFATGHFVPEYLGPAIAEDANARLSNMCGADLRVLARDSVFTLAALGKTALEIGTALKADLVLTGTLNAIFAHFRLRAEMIRVADGTQIWAEDVLVDRDRITGLHTELAERLMHRLCRHGVSINIEASAIEHGSERPQLAAYDSYLRGHYEWQTLKRHQMQDGLQYLLRALELDPGLMPAKIDLAHLCVAESLFGYMSSDVAAERVRGIAASVEGFPRGAEAILPVMGWIDFHVDRDLPAAIRAFSLSAHLPHDPWITRVRATFLLSRHRFSEAIDLLRRTAWLDPFSAWLHARLAWALHLDGQAAESLERIRHALGLFPEHESTALYGAMILAYNGEPARAIELAEGLAHRTPYFDLATAVHAYSLACAGRFDEARGSLERLQWLGRERHVLKSFNPAAYVALGDLDSALSELRASAQARCPWFFQMLADPRLKPLHGHPEFEKLRAILTQMEAQASGI